MSKRQPSPNHNLLLAINMHPMAIAQAIDGYRLRFCHQHFLLGFQAQYNERRWRFIGKKWHKVASEYQYCGTRYCPTMRPPIIDMKRRYLKRLIEILDHCHGHETHKHTYSKRWGYIDHPDVTEAYY